MAEENAQKATKQVADEIAEVRSAAKEESAKNVISSRFSKTDTFKFHEGEDDEQTYLFQFPGTTRASQLMDASANPFGNINQTYFMQQAIAQHVIVEPKIKDLSYFDTHKGYTEVYNQLYQFLTGELN